MGKKKEEQGLETFLKSEFLNEMQHTVTKGSKLIEKYALATTPGLDLTDPKPLTRENLKVLAMGLSESVRAFGVVCAACLLFVTIVHFEGLSPIQSDRPSQIL